MGGKVAEIMKYFFFLCQSKEMAKLFRASRFYANKAS